MKDRILKLCKRLDKFSLAEIQSISEIDENILKSLLQTLSDEKRLTFKDEIYFYNKKICTGKQNSKLPLFFHFHDKQTIDCIIKCFCSDVEVFKMMNIFSTTKHVSNNFYQYFRTVIYKNQYQELLKHYNKKPKLPQERIYMNAKVYLYLYDDRLFVSEKYIATKNAVKHTEAERLEIKNIYLRSYRKVLSRSFAHKFHLHLAEELWKYGKEFNEQYFLINKMLFS